MCVDYSRINAQSEKEAFPLLRIDDLWLMLSKFKYFAALDLIIGFYKVDVETAGRYKTAFITHKRLLV